MIGSNPQHALIHVKLFIQTLHQGALDKGELILVKAWNATCITVIHTWLLLQREFHDVNRLWF